MSNIDSPISCNIRNRTSKLKSTQNNELNDNEIENRLQMKSANKSLVRHKYKPVEVSLIRLKVYFAIVYPAETIEKQNNIKEC